MKTLCFLMLFVTGVEAATIITDQLKATTAEATTLAAESIKVFGSYSGAQVDDSRTVGGYPVSATSTPNTVVIRNSDGGVPGVTLYLLNSITYSLLTKADATLTTFSVGPTGSGAQKIFSPLDNVPLDAKYLVLTIQAETVHSSDVSALCNSLVMVLDNTNGTYYGIAQSDAYVSNSKSIDSNLCIVPVTDRTFRLSWTRVSTTNSTNQGKVALVGYIK